MFVGINAQHTTPTMRALLARFETLVLGSEAPWMEVVRQQAALQELQARNKAWRLRLVFVRYLHQWVAENLDPNAPVYGGVDKKGSTFKKLQKARQYVSEHFALGKMLFPTGGVDPLFTEHDYADDSLTQQLLPGKYAEFRARLQGQVEVLRDFNPDTGDIVSWEEVVRDLSGAQVRKLGVLWRACMGSGSMHVKAEMIGLVLRYKCICGFDSPMHGSVKQEWANCFAGYTECFASPFNHKFREYFSVFDEDVFFGSKGNFFAMVHRNGGVLRPGRYEMNPPWMNAMFDRIRDIVDRTLVAGVAIQLILVAPDWRKPLPAPLWISGLNGIQLPPSYMENTQYWIQRLSYQQDMSENGFDKNTLLWFFSTAPLPVAAERVLGRGLLLGK